MVFPFIVNFCVAFYIVRREVHFADNICEKCGAGLRTNNKKGKEDVGEKGAAIHYDNNDGSINENDVNNGNKDGNGGGVIENDGNKNVGELKKK